MCVCVFCIRLDVVAVPCNDATPYTEVHDHVASEGVGLGICALSAAAKTASVRTRSGLAVADGVSNTTWKPRLVVQV